MEALRTGSLLVATVMVGLVAGVFALYAHTIMPGLGRTDDRTFAVNEARWRSWNLVRGHINGRLRPARLGARPARPGRLTGPWSARVSYSLGLALLGST
jgi:hypothetical protein